MNRSEFTRRASERGANSPRAIAELLGIKVCDAANMLRPPSGKLFSVSELTAQRTLNGLGFEPYNYGALFADGEVKFDDGARASVGRSRHVRDPEHDIPGTRKKAALHSGRMCTKCFIELPTGAPADVTLCDDCK